MKDFLVYKNQHGKWVLAYAGKPYIWADTREALIARIPPGRRGADAGSGNQTKSRR
jgi:hypothetical protein